MGKSLQIIFISILTTSIVSGQVTHISKFRKFSMYGFNSGATLRVSKDSFFLKSVAISCTGRGDSIFKIKGTYKQKGNRVKFKPLFAEEKGYEKTTYTRIPINKYWRSYGEYELLCMDSFVMLLATDSLTVGQLDTNYIAKNDFVDILSQINTRGNADLNFMHIWTTYEGERQPVLDHSLKNNLPAKWKKFLLDQPVECHIIDSTYLKFEDRPYKSNAYQYIVTLDKGSENGILYGTKLFCENASIRVIQVGEKTCKGYLFCDVYSRFKYFLEPNKIYSTRQSD